MLPGTVACMIPPHSQQPWSQTLRASSAAKQKLLWCVVATTIQCLFFSLTRRPRAGLAYPYPVPPVCAETTQRARRRGGGGIGACRWRRVKCSCRPPPQPAVLLGHAIGSRFDTFGYGVLLPPTSTTILDPDSETKRRSSEDRGGPASALGWSRGWMGGITDWGRLMRSETSFLMRRLLVAYCRSVFG